MRNNIVVGDFTFEVSNLDDIKDTTSRNIKKYGYMILVTSIRIYFRSTNTFKKVYLKTKIKLSELNNKTDKYFKKDTVYVKVEKVPSFLQAVGEYKKKIKTIKSKIKEEEME